MNVLIICSGNKGESAEISPFISDQVKAIETLEKAIRFHYFHIKGKGVFGYLKNFNRLKAALSENKIDVIHAHYSFSGFLANIQRKVPVITTYHGSDINVFKNKIISIVVQVLSKQNIYVSKQLYQNALVKSRSVIIPCGVDLKLFKPMNKETERNYFNLDLSKCYILFSSYFNNAVKNYELLKNAIATLNNNSVEVIELKGLKRHEVAKLMNAVDICVLTSFSEGSPQFIKEAMSCNKPIVATKVGDITWLFGNVHGCFFADFDTNDLKNKINSATEYSEYYKNTEGRNRIISLGLDAETTAKKIIDVYDNVMTDYENC
jgi:glycosyltransferase involved in cell wall biosynthesis